MSDQPAARWLTRVTRFAWVVVAILAIGLVAAVTFAWVSSTITKRLDAISGSVTLNALTNRQAFCNTERLLLVRAIQNGYVVPANASVDVCGLPIIGTPPLPHEGPTLPPGAPIPPLTPRPSSAPTKPAANVPHSTPTPGPTPAPRPSPSPTPNCVLIVCVN